MPTSKKSTASHHDAISLLETDHKHVKKLFKDFEKMKDKGADADKEALVAEICAELILHTTIEEEVFYPAARAAIDADDLMDEAEVEHASATNLIEQLQTMDSSDPLYDAKVTVLGEYVGHHIEEEEKEMFPKVKKAKLDLEAIGEQMAEMKESQETQLLAAQSKGAQGKGSSARH